MAKPPTAAATMMAGASTLMDLIWISSNVNTLVVDAGGSAPHWTGEEVNIISRSLAMAPGRTLLGGLRAVSKPLPSGTLNLGFDFEESDRWLDIGQHC